jgi:hypothetical protein
MSRFFQRLGYGLLANILFVFSYVVSALLFVLSYTRYLYKWLPDNKTGNRIFFFLDDRRVDADDTLFDLYAQTIVIAARFYWMSNFTSANYGDAAELAGEK